MCLFNIRSWNVHLEHFLSDKYTEFIPLILFPVLFYYSVNHLAVLNDFLIDDVIPWGESTDNSTPLLFC